MKLTLTTEEARSLNKILDLAQFLQDELGKSEITDRDLMIAKKLYNKTKQKNKDLFDELFEKEEDEDIEEAFLF